MEASYNAESMAIIIVAAIGAVGTVILQALQMYLSYKRGEAIKADVHQVVKATNGITEKMADSHVLAEKVIMKAELAAHQLLLTAAAAAAAAKNK